MTDPAPAVPQPTNGDKKWYSPTAHPAVASSLLAGSITNLIIAFAAPWCQNQGIDLASHAGDISIIMGAIVGFFTPATSG